MDIKNLKELYEHMEWANATVWSAIMACENGKIDSKVRDYFYHLHMVEFAFLRVWQSEGRETPYPVFDDSKELMLWGYSYYKKIFEYFITLIDEKIAEPISVPWAEMVEKRIGRMPQTTTIGETMLQVVLHSTYHRGQINHRLREIGGEPPLVDYIAWVWLDRPSANWPTVLSN